MIKEKSSNGGSISYTDSNLEPETYTINTMDEFNKKYGKYYKEKRWIKKIKLKEIMRYVEENSDGTIDKRTYTISR